MGDVIEEADGTIYGDGVNIAARLEKLAEPGGICIGRNIYDQVRGKLVCAYDDLGEQQFHNIPEPVRAFRVRSASAAVAASPAAEAPPLSDKPSIAVLAFSNMSGDPDQEYFSDGITEDIITELSRFLVGTSANDPKRPDWRGRSRQHHRVRLVQSSPAAPLSQSCTFARLVSCRAPFRVSRVSTAGGCGRTLIER